MLSSVPGFTDMARCFAHHSMQMVCWCCEAALSSGTGSMNVYLALLTVYKCWELA